jgi:ABC-2 type transport system permease protein
MTGSVVARLILKDWRLQRLPILLSIVGGVIALTAVQFGGETPMIIGAVWFFIVLILVGTMLPLVGIVNERKKQNLAFLMSLPISPLEYTAGKLVSTVGMFLVPWLTLVTVALLLIETRGIVPHGAIPITLILAALPFVSLSLLTGAALVGESEGWGMAVNVICNSSYWLVWFFLSRIPALMENVKGSIAVWNSTAVTILSSEFGFIALILGLTFYLQSRKRDFV